jgi:endoglucanase
MLRPLAAVAAILFFLLPGKSHAEPPRIALNTVGYLANAPKKASIVADAGHFRVERLPSHAVVLEGDCSPSATNPDTRESISIADFSAVAQPGEYQLSLGNAASPKFRIGGDVYREPFYLATRAMYLWRCGTAVSARWKGDQFHHEACHLEDGWLDVVAGEHVRKPSVGGWHDAGDYNKYVVNAGATVGVMFRAWEEFRPRIEHMRLDIPESGGKLPDFLAELKWEIDWLLTVQADDGSVYHKLSAKNFCGFILPERETQPRYFSPVGSAATADFVAMTAAASRHFAPFDKAYADKCLAAARKSYDYLRAHPQNIRLDLKEFKTGGYETFDADDRLWAAAELWETTGDETVLKDLEAMLSDRRSTSIDVDWDWSNLKNLGLLAYLYSKRTGRDPTLVEQVRGSLIAAADAIVETAKTNGYARPLGEKYYWGCNGSVARQTLVLQAAFRLTGDNKYRHTGLDALNHLLGRNFYGRSYVTSLGHQPPLHPHDRRSIADDIANPWPGYLVGGPQPNAKDWRDDQEDYRTNEIAINWNAALIYALAAYLDAPPNTP